MQRSSLKILQNYDIWQGSGAQRQTSLLASLFCMCWLTNICAVAVNGICMGKSCPHASGSFLLTNVDLLWANFFYFIYFHYRGMKNLFVCPPIYLVFHPPPFRICTVPFTWLRCGGILPNCCELNCGVACSRGMTSGLAGMAMGYAATR